ncbi:metalloregulator ArsR/SmtB family transcription factor [Microbacterium sp.]|uniref:ArsR/SmtB family transcription factor n=2 Tax=unclassified Microbacterium TaxID=2609290 RepID=UPI00345AD9AB
MPSMRASPSPFERSQPPLERTAAETLTRTLRVVADPTRLQLLSVILGSADRRATVGQLAEALGLTQPTLTHHVRILVEDGVLLREREGKFVWLSVAADRAGAIEDLLR